MPDKHAAKDASPDQLVSPSQLRTGGSLLSAPSGISGMKHDSDKCRLDLLPGDAISAAMSLEAPSTVFNPIDIFIDLTTMDSYDGDLTLLLSELTQLVLQQLSWDLVGKRDEWAAINQVGLVMTHGARKYADHNWRKGIHYSRIKGACLRHLLAYAQGEAMDPESGLPHLAHLACELLFILQFEIEGRGSMLNDLYKEQISG